MSWHTLPRIEHRVWKIWAFALAHKQLLGLEFSSNYQEFIYIQSDQSLILIFEFLLTSCFLNSLHFFSSGESSSIGTMCLEVPVTIAFKAPFTLQCLWWLTSNLFTFLKSFDECSGSVNFVVGGSNPWGCFEGEQKWFERVCTLKLLFDFNS